jgi:putative endonuclease
MNTKNIGRIYEKKAKQYLKSKNYQILEQNWQCGRIGELDFVIKDNNRFNSEYLVFIEVKYRQDGIFAAKAAVNFHKQKQLQKLAQLYLKSKKLDEGTTNISYDVIAISPSSLEHVQNIFNL